MENEFDAMLLEAVDEALKEIFGQTATRTIYAHIENHLSMKRKEIPKRLEDLHKGLDEFLGSGAFVVEEMILKNLHSRLGVKREIKSDRSFADHVNKLRGGI